jgi:hypothetical protein
MKWTKAYFAKQAKIWEDRKTGIDAENADNAGMISYACRQVDMWKSFEQFASECFSSVM